MIPLLTSDRMDEHETGDHVERVERRHAVLQALAAQPWKAGIRVAEPPPVPPEALRRVHTEAMMAASRELALAGGGSLDPDTPVSKGSWAAALLAAGATVEAARLVARGDARGAFALVRPPGHHATRERAMGFCLLNNVAVAAQRLLDLKLARRIAVFDHDVHHGNGTQDVFWASPDVLYVSVHQWPLYPGTGRLEEVGAGEGEGHSVNLPVKAGTGEGGYAALLDEVVLPIAESFKPDLWLVSAGYDSHAQDLLGSLALTSGFYATILAKLAEAQPRMALALEGGYHLGMVGRSAVSQLAWLSGNEVPAWGEVPREDRDVRPLVRDARRALAKYWTF